MTRQAGPTEQVLSSLVSMDSVDMFGSPNTGAPVARPDKLQLEAGAAPSNDTSTSISAATESPRMKGGEDISTSVKQSGKNTKSTGGISNGVSKGSKRPSGKVATQGAQDREGQGVSTKASSGSKAAQAAATVEAVSDSTSPRVPIWEKQPVWRQASLEGAAPSGAGSSNPRSANSRPPASPQQRQEESYLARRPRDSSLKMRAKTREAAFSPTRTSSLAPSSLSRENSALGAGYGTPPAAPAAASPQPSLAGQQGQAAATEAQPGASPTYHGLHLTSLHADKYFHQYILQWTAK